MISLSLSLPFHILNILISFFFFKIGLFFFLIEEYIDLVFIFIVGLDISIMVAIKFTVCKKKKKLRAWMSTPHYIYCEWWYIWFALLNWLWSFDEFRSSHVVFLILSLSLYLFFSLYTHTHTHRDDHSSVTVSERSDALKRKRDNETSFNTICNLLLLNIINLILSQIK